MAARYDRAVTGLVKAKGKGDADSMRDQKTRLAGAIASAITILCALVLALDGNPPMRWLFVGWSAANTLWVFYALRLPSMSLLSSQIVFCLIDVAGMLHYWIL
ncbi:hypothetical protein [Acidithiobacillus caldus]|nr:hypothetical protein [Acidithiobacillus caldus]